MLAGLYQYRLCNIRLGNGLYRYRLGNVGWAVSI